MSIHYNDQGKRFGIARSQQSSEGLVGILEKYFAVETLQYLEEGIINHIMDSLSIHASRNHFLQSMATHFNDYSFTTAPAYKALEGFLFQIAKDLKLPCDKRREHLAGSYYFDEEKIEKHINKLLKELKQKAAGTIELTQYEKRDIKDKIKEMDGFLRHYRNTPAHYYGESVDSIELAQTNIMIIYGAINNTVRLFLKSKLIKINNE